MKIVVLGKTGQVGQALLRCLHVLGEVIALGRTEFDATQFSLVEQCLLHHAPDVIINAVAYTAVDRAEQEPLLARQVNTDFVHQLALLAKRYDALLVHYSTDYVFDGEKNSSYVEADPTNPLSVYGITKRDGELAVLTSGCRGLVLRTSWVYSLVGHNFINTILQLAKTRTHLTVVADQWGAPTSAEWIAEMTTVVLKAYFADQFSEGLTHLTASGRTSWHALAHYVVEKAQALGMPLQLQPHQILPISTTKYPLPAKRPLNSCLDTQHLSHQLQRPCVHWQGLVDHFLSQKKTRLGR